MKGFVGNVEGRDVMKRSADVIVTDGFTGNVTLKTLEGAVFGLAEKRSEAPAELPPPRSLAHRGAIGGNAAPLRRNTSAASRI